MTLGNFSTLVMCYKKNKALDLIDLNFMAQNYPVNSFQLPGNLFHNKAMKNGLVTTTPQVFSKVFLILLIHHLLQRKTKCSNRLGVHGILGREEGGGFCNRGREGGG